MVRKLPDKIRVTVTRNMIHWAVTESSTQCAIALALRDADPDGLFERPFVAQHRISITDRYTDRRYHWDEEQIPEKLKSWIDQFDHDPTKCRPFTFYLDSSMARSVPIIHKTKPEQVTRQREHNRKFEEKYPERRSETVAVMEARRQAKIPTAQRQGIVHTSKRERRNVDIPENAGVIE